jgi:hypothetical protein
VFSPSNNFDVIKGSGFFQAGRPLSTGLNAKFAD